MPRHRILVPWVLGLLALAGCGGESRRSAAESLRSAFNPLPPPADTIPEQVDYAADLQVDIAEMIKSPSGVLYSEDSTGGGAVAAVGDSAEIRFEGWLPNGVRVDSASGGIRIGAGDVIPGIDAALPGMKVGGRRRLVLSPGLAFGAEGRDAIPPSAVLVYLLELRALNP